MLNGHVAVQYSTLGEKQRKTNKPIAAFMYQLLDWSKIKQKQTNKQKQKAKKNKKQKTKNKTKAKKNKKKQRITKKINAAFMQAYLLLHRNKTKQIQKNKNKKTTTTAKLMMLSCTGFKQLSYLA